MSEEVRNNKKKYCFVNTNIRYETNSSHSLTSSHLLSFCRYCTLSIGQKIRIYHFSRGQQNERKEIMLFTSRSEYISFDQWHKVIPCDSQWITVTQRLFISFLGRFQSKLYNTKHMKCKFWRNINKHKKWRLLSHCNMKILLINFF